MNADQRGSKQLPEVPKIAEIGRQKPLKHRGKEEAEEKGRVLCTS
jgi:hypothetical protein